jgi:hypothetical protein
VPQILENTFKRLLSKLLIACVSCVILSVLLSLGWYYDEPPQQETPFILSLWNYSIISLTYSLPVYLIFGIPFSYVADVISSK